jgi:hypothetical protein
MEHIVSCPQAGCGASAEIVDRWVWLSTDGPVEHVKIWCVNGHGFTPALDTPTVQPEPNLPPEPAVDATVG